jgi:hypothetical protein
MEDFFLKATGQDENESIFPTLSLKERLIGFAICFGLGSIFQFLSMGSLGGLLLGHANKFAFLYTCGNIITIFGTFFLIGPARQFKLMTDPIRKNATIIFISSLIMTLVSVYCFHSRFLTIIFVLSQFCSYIWYILSYIPYGRDCLKTIISRVTGFN